MHVKISTSESMQQQQNYSYKNTINEKSINLKPFEKKKQILKKKKFKYNRVSPGLLTISTMYNIMWLENYFIKIVAGKYKTET